LQIQSTKKERNLVAKKNLELFLCRNFCANNVFAQDLQNANLHLFESALVQIDFCVKQTLIELTLVQKVISINKL
jgi:hypothetical protein